MSEKSRQYHLLKEKLKIRFRPNQIQGQGSGTRQINLSIGHMPCVYWYDSDEWLNCSVENWEWSMVILLFTILKLRWVGLFLVFIFWWAYLEYAAHPHRMGWPKRWVDGWIGIWALLRNGREAAAAWDGMGGGEQEHNDNLYCTEHSTLHSTSQCTYTLKTMYTLKT